jgi:hypothetical protein
MHLFVQNKEKKVDLISGLAAVKERIQDIYIF